MLINEHTKLVSSKKKMFQTSTWLIYEAPKLSTKYESWFIQNLFPYKNRTFWDINMVIL